jgi:predicted nucleotidyltransferase
MSHLLGNRGAHRDAARQEANMNDEQQTPKTIQDIVQRIVAGYAPQKIILFGSYADGTPDEDSDIDLLIVKNTDKRPIERWMEVKRLLRDRDRRAAVSPLVYTPSELERRLAIKDFFIQEVLEKGQVLYG